jgi:hypothetical protein
MFGIKNDIPAEEMILPDGGEDDIQPGQPAAQVIPGKNLGFRIAENTGTFFFQHLAFGTTGKVPTGLTVFPIKIVQSNQVGIDKKSQLRILGIQGVTE